MALSGISFSGVGSGLPVSQMIEAIMGIERQPVERLYSDQTSLNTAKTTLTTMGGKISSLRSSVESFTDANIASAFDLFLKRTASSTDAAIASVTASNNSAIQTVKLKVINLATPTTAQSINSPGRSMNGGEIVSKLGNGSAIVTMTDADKKTVGTTFSIYVDNKKYTINLNEDTTVSRDSDGDGVVDANSIAGQIKTATGGLLTAKVTNGKFEIGLTDPDSEHNIQLGSTSDTSNFLNVMQLNTKTSGTDTEGKAIITKITSDSQISSIDTNGTISGLIPTAHLNTPVTNGNFTIGKATFSVGEGTTLQNLIASINSNKDANVVAVFDVRTNKLKLTSKDPGATSINLSNDNLTNDATEKSNFLSVMGLTVSNSGDPKDNTIAVGSQTLGKNANVELNGNLLEANTNTLGSDITGMLGVSIKLNGTTASTTNGTSTVDLSIQQDTNALVTSLNNFLTKFNDLTGEVDKDTASTGGLKSDYTLIRFKNELRMNTMDMLDGLTEYSSLGTIGVSTGAIGTSVDTKTNTLSLDSAKFLAALTDNPSEVRALFVGDKAKGITGIFQTLKEALDKAMDPISGYVNTRKDSVDSQLTTIAKSIEDGELRMKDKKAELTRQYAQMDQLISQMKSQSTSFGI